MTGEQARNTDGVTFAQVKWNGVPANERSAR